MALSIKIHGQTPTGGRSICHTCKHATVITGQNCEERIVCDHPELWRSSANVVRFRVATCGSYHPLNHPWKWEMEEMAWKVEARKRGPKGFGDAVTEDGMEIIVTPPKSNSGMPSE